MKSRVGQRPWFKLSVEDIEIVDVTVEHARYPEFIDRFNGEVQAFYRFTMKPSDELIEAARAMGLETCLYRFEPRGDDMAKAADLKGLRNVERKKALIDAANQRLDEWIEEYAEAYVEKCKQTMANWIQTGIDAELQERFEEATA